MFSQTVAHGPRCEEGVGFRLRIMEPATTTLLGSVSDGSAIEFSQQRGFDNVGNLALVNTSIPQGNIKQESCYDEPNQSIL